MKGPYKLKLTKLDFLSAVDSPAQGMGAQALLLKRKVLKRAGVKVDAVDVKLTAKVAKLNDELGLVFGYAFSTSLDGGNTPHIDFQEDAIDPDFLKVAMQFIEGGGHTDVNHDFAKDGKIVFAWPLLPEINKALGIDAKQLGLAVAVKPTAETYAKFKSGELTGFSIAGQGERIPLETKSLRKHLFMRVLKEAVLTSNVDGHQHAVALDDPSTYWCDMYQTSYQNMEGAEQGHSHAWTFDAATGAITIAADSGHTHTIDAVVPLDVLAAYAKLELAKDAENAAIAAAPIVVEDDPSDGIPSVLPVEESSGATIVIAIEARNAGGNSTPLKVAPTVKAHPETKPMNFAKHLPIILAMSADERAYLGKLGEKDAEAFVEKSASDRIEIVKSVRGAEVYKSDRLGRTFYATDDQTMVAMAKDADVQHLELQKAKLRAENAEIEKRAAADLSHFAKGVGVAGAILRAVDGIADETIRKDAIESLKGANVAMKELATAKGVTDTGGPVAVTKASAYAALEKGLVAYCNEHKIEKSKHWLDGLDGFSQTPDGAALIKAHDAAKRAETQPAAAN